MFWSESELQLLAGTALEGVAEDDRCGLELYNMFCLCLRMMGAAVQCLGLNGLRVYNDLQSAMQSSRASRDSPGGWLRMTGARVKLIYCGLGLNDNCRFWRG
jgi:hypothetical protein